MSVNFKLAYNGQLYRFTSTLLADELLRAIKAKVATIVTEEDSQLFWKDGDSKMALNSASDLNEAIGFANFMNKNPNKPPCVHLFVMDKIALYEGEIEKLKKDLSNKTKHSLILSEQLRDAETKMATLDEDLETATAKYERRQRFFAEDIDTLNKQLAELNQDYMELAQTNAKLESESAELSKKCDHLVRRNEMLENEYDKLEAKMKEVERENGCKQEIQKQFDEHKEKADKDITRLQKTLCDLELTMAHDEAQWERMYDTLENEYKQLEETNRKLEAEKLKNAAPEVDYEDKYSVKARIGDIKWEIFKRVSEAEALRKALVRLEQEEQAAVAAWEAAQAAAVAAAENQSSDEIVVCTEELLQKAASDSGSAWTDVDHEEVVGDSVDHAKNTDVLQQKSYAGSEYAWSDVDDEEVVEEESAKDESKSDYVLEDGEVSCLEYEGSDVDGVEKHDEISDEDWAGHTGIPIEMIRYHSKAKQASLMNEKKCEEKKEEKKEESNQKELNADQINASVLQYEYLFDEKRHAGFEAGCIGAALPDRYSDAYERGHKRGLLWFEYTQKQKHAVLKNLSTGRKDFEISKKVDELKNGPFSETMASFSVKIESIGEKMDEMKKRLADIEDKNFDKECKMVELQQRLDNVEDRVDEIVM